MSLSELWAAAVLSLRFLMPLTVLLVWMSVLLSQRPLDVHARLRLQLHAGCRWRQRGNECCVGAGSCVGATFYP